MKKLLEIDKLLKYSKITTILALSFCFASILSSFLYSVYLNEKFEKNSLFILDSDKNAFSVAKANDPLMFRDPEITNHLKIFHNNFLEIDQFNYNKRIEKALGLIGEVGKTYYLQLFNKGFYDNLKINNLVQTIKYDSIKVYSSMYPYKAFVYAKTKIFRYGEENEGLQKIYRAECQLQNIERTLENPHGLLITDYKITKHGR